MRNIKHLILVSLLGITISGCSSLATTKDIVIQNTNNTNYKESSLSTSTEENPLTVKQVAAYLKTCKEHYPLSDEFIERYQQNSGGYLDYAKECEVEVNRQIHSPNQKWHFLHSWLDQSLMEKPSVLDADGKQRCYSNLLCPELLLWIFEACNVEHTKLLECMKAAENGKATGLTTTKIASAMKEIVSWEDVKAGIVVPEMKDSDYTHTVNISGANVVDLKNSYVRAEKVTIKLEDDSLEVDKFSSISGVTSYINEGDNEYYFYMPDCDVNISITTKAKPTQTLVCKDDISVGLSKTYQLNPSLSYGSGTFSYSCNDNSVATVSAAGLVSGLKIGTCKITVTCIEKPELTKIVNVTVKDTSGLVDSTYSISYDMGTRKTSKAFESTTEIYNSLVTTDTKLINSITSFENVYGGGNGGRSDTSWIYPNMIKIGTTAVNGSLVFNLDQEVNTIKITGYVNSQSLKLRVGDSTSTDWTSATDDNKTTAITKTSLTVATKESVEANEEETITLTFDATSSLKLATINTTSSKHVLFITSLEFIYDEKLGK